MPRARDYLHLLRDGWLIILSATLLSGGASWQVQTHRDPIYTANARLFAVIPGGPGTRSAVENNRGALSRMETYAELAKSPQVTARAVDTAQLEESPRELASRITTVVTPGSVLLDISVTGDDSATTRDAANAVATNLIAVSRELASSDKGPVAELVVVDGAVTAAATRASLARYLLLGGSIGLSLSVVLVLARGIWRDAVLDRRQVDHVIAEAVPGAAR